MGLADSENDYATRSFLQWFVDEQVEEVSSMTDLLTLVKMAGDNLLQVEARVRHEMMAAK
jgi:ferritin